MDGFITPNKLKQIAVKDLDYQFVYKKVPKQEQKPSEGTKNPIKTPPKREINKQNTGNGAVSNVGSFVANRSNAKKTIYVKESPVFQNTPSTQSSFYNVSSNTKETGVQEKKDPFLENTGMTQEDKKIFLNYIHEVAKDARTKYGNDQNKINHAIANAIAYSAYHDNLLQKSTNDFGEKPRNLSEDVEELLMEIHGKDKYKLDFPHLAMPLATAEKSVWYKEFGKFIAGLSPLNIVGVTPSDTFFQANSLWGDEMTYLDKKDYITDIDAYILKYHPDFKDLSLDERIEKYYSIEKLDEKRGEYYKQILEMKSEGAGAKVYADVLKVGSILSVATFGLLLLNIKNGISDFLKTPRKMIKEIIIPSLVNNIKEFIKEFKKNPLAYIGNKIFAPLGNFVADAIVTTKSVVTFTAYKINNKIIKPIVNRVVKPIYNAVVRPITTFINNRVVKPLYNNVVKPVTKWGYTKIVKPVYNNVVKPVIKWGYNNVIKPAYNYVVKPIYNNIIKPVAKWGYTNIVKPVYNNVVRPIYNNIFKPVYNKVAKPFVEPIYNKVIKPASNWISDKYNKTSNWISDKYNKVKNWF